MLTRPLWLTASLCFLSFVLSTANATDFGPGKNDVDNALQELKSNTVNLLRDMQTLESQILGASGPVLNVFLDTGTARLDDLQQISVELDGTTIYQLSPTVSQLQALAKSGGVILLHQGIGAGAHHLVVSLDQDKVEHSIEGKEGTIQLHVHIDEKKKRRKLSILDVSKSPDSSSLSVKSDDILRSAHFDFQNEDYLSSLSRLMAGRHMGWIDMDSSSLDNLLTQIRLAYGLYDQAFEYLQNHIGMHASQSWLSDREGWLRLAQHYFDMGDNERAQFCLQQVNVPDSLDQIEERRQLLQLRLQARQDRFAEALQNLNVLLKQSGHDLLWRYNVAVFLLKNEHKEKGLEILEKLVATKTSSRDAVATRLKELSSLILSRYAYKDKKYPLAAQYTVKIWSDSPYYHSAQLLLGKAVLAQGKTEAGIQEWQRIGGDIMDESVQEANLQLSQALLMAGKTKQAENAFGESIRLMKTALQQLGVLYHNLEQGRYLKQVLAGEPVPGYGGLLLEHLSDPILLRQIEMVHVSEGLLNTLQRWRERIPVWSDMVSDLPDQTVKSRFAQRVEQQSKRLETLLQQTKRLRQRMMDEVANGLLQETRLQQRRLRGNLARSYYGLASLHDQQLSIGVDK